MHRQVATHETGKLGDGIDLALVIATVTERLQMRALVVVPHDRVALGGELGRLQVAQVAVLRGVGAKSK